MPVCKHSLQIQTMLLQKKNFVAGWTHIAGKSLKGFLEK